jgi:hypothetical protein
VGIAGQIGGKLSSHGHLQGVVEPWGEPPNVLSHSVSTICCTASNSGAVELRWVRGRAAAMSLADFF